MGRLAGMALVALALVVPVRAPAAPSPPLDADSDGPEADSDGEEVGSNDGERVDQRPEVPTPPPGFDQKTPLDADDLERKKERHDVTGLPLANFDTNTGVGGGVRLYYYFNGEREDPLFAYTPYLHRVFAQAFFTSKGLQFHWLNYDAPAIAGTPYRLRAQAIYLRNTQSKFFQLGNRSLDPLTFTGAGRTYDDYGDYEDALDEIRPDGTTLARYNDFDIKRPIFILSLERTMFDGLLRPFIGLGFNYSIIDDYTGEVVNAEDGDAVMGPTLLREQCDLGDVVGCDGGWDNALRMALSLDTRDFEPDPNHGTFVDMALDLSTGLLGSEYDYWKFMISGRYFLSLLPSITDLVGAARFTFQAQSAGTPFWALNYIPFTEDPRNGLGGHRTLRGYRQDRFVGRYFTLLNLELRWTFHRFEVLRQKFGLGLTGFFDTGRVYDRFEDITYKRWRHGQGLGFRISWNLATIVAVDYGISGEDTGIYINFNHQF